MCSSWNNMCPTMADLLLVVVVVSTLHSSLSVPLRDQCGGTTSACKADLACSRMACDAGTECKRVNATLWQCQPDLSKVHGVLTWDQCGGTTSACEQDASCFALRCPVGTLCRRQSVETWRCEPDEDLVQTASNLELCGGKLSPCAVNGTCVNIRCLEGTRCVHITDNEWLCLPPRSSGARQAEESSAFVRTDGYQFKLNGRPFYIVGVNAYWLADMGVGRGAVNAWEVEELFRQAQRRHLSAVRTWAFNQGMPRGPGDYDEQQMKRMDFVVATAGRYGIKLVLTLGNFWPEVKAPEDYVAFVHGSAAGRTAKDFYTDPRIVSIYHDHIRYMMNRRNTFTGVQYKDDPAIMSWGILNEPRFPGAGWYDQRLLVDWIKDAARVIKEVDSNHLVSAGLDGLFTNDGKRNYHLYNPGVGGQCEGSDFIAISQLHDIDYAVAHMFPGLLEMLPNPDPGRSDWITCDWNCFMSWGKQWLDLHRKAAATDYYKPFVVEETGISLQRYTMDQRKQWMRLLLDELEASARNGQALGGILIWNAALQNFQDYDGNTIYLDKAETRPVSGENVTTVELLNPILSYPSSLGTIVYSQPNSSSPIIASLAPEDETDRMLRRTPAVIDPRNFRLFDARMACAQWVANNGWRQAFQIRGVLDPTSWEERVREMTDVSILQDAGWNLRPN